MIFGTNVLRHTISAALFLALSASMPVFAQSAASASQDHASTSSSALNLDPSTKKPSEYFQKAVTNFRNAETTAPRHGIVLLGDSITSRWGSDKFPGKNVINRGIGGDHIGGWNYFGLLDRLDTSIKVLEPSRIFLMIGINDMLENGPPMDNMVAAYSYLLDQLKLQAPNAEIIVQSILPVSKPEFAYMHKPIIEMNQHIKRLAGEKDLRYVDLYSRFKDENGLLKKELTVDGVHLTPDGYRLWLDVLTAERILIPENDSTSHTVQMP